MGRRWLVLTGVLIAARAAVTQPPPAKAPPAGPAAPPTAVQPIGPQKPHEWPREIEGKTVGYYIDRLSNSDPSVRWMAVRVLPLYGPAAARPACRQLMALIDDTDPGVRVNAILALASIGFETKDDLHKGVAALRKAIGGTVPGSAIRPQAVRALGLIGTEAHTAIDALLTASRDPAWETRDAAAAALGRAGMPVYDPKPLPAGSPIPQPLRAANGLARARLLDLLKDPAQPVRLEAIQGLLYLGPPTPKDPDQYMKEAQTFIDEVQKRLGAGIDKPGVEKDPHVRLWLQTLLLMYDDRQAVAAVREMRTAVTAAELPMRVQGLTALTMCGPYAAGAIDEVRSAVRATEPEVVMAAISCLMRMGPDARKAVGDLQAVGGSHANEEVRKTAAEAARLLSPGAVPDKK